MTTELIIKFLWIGAGVFGGLLVLATAVKMREVWLARNWLMTAGRIITAKVESRRRTGVGEKAGTMANYPSVVYEYTVAGRRYTGKRINIGENLGDVDVEATLDRYPHGAKVDVYYNPAKPEQAVLEREPPPNFGKAIGGLLAVVVGCAVVLPIGIREFIDRIATYIERPENTAVVALLFGMAMLTALIGFALQRQQQTAEKWSSTVGTILETAIEAKWGPNAVVDRRKRGVTYQPRITYAYDVRGRRYQSDRLSLSGMTSGMMAAWLNRLAVRPNDPSAQIQFVDSTGGYGEIEQAPIWVVRQVAKYREGSEVIVHFDPSNPAEAILEKRTQHLSLIWGITAALLILALAAGGVIGS